MLVGSRILQGGMAAMMVPQVLAIIHATFPAHERGKVFGMFGGDRRTRARSPGPSLGALLTQWNLFGLRVAADLPDQPARRDRRADRSAAGSSASPRRRRRSKLDLVGVGLSVLGLLMLRLPADPGPGAGLAAVGLC